jgi:hypothetical protein
MALGGDVPRLPRRVRHTAQRDALAAAFLPRHHPKAPRSSTGAPSCTTLSRWITSEICPVAAGDAHRLADPSEILQDRNWYDNVVFEQLIAQYLDGHPWLERFHQ